MQQLGIIYVIVATSGCLITARNVPGYYWRDYHGEIPEDALPGGLDSGNRPIYIGQVFAAHLIPAKIYATDQRAYYEYSGKEHAAIENVKYSEKFKWIPTNASFSSLNDKYLVLGGYEPGSTTYIGRARYKGEIAVGKALADNPETAGLHISRDGKGMRLLSSFEVLSFNSSAKQT